ncbi:hypothetical protein LUZ61_001400 [Rhynchospora tenuis]|uniref:Protein kinase domain-containing protein n=1 Tax=Rhynchospora tenuis TaxID=198213 RepID=A0AAD5ZH20_9POAL|nr:hypothetical protein LUZ61_001400 [Rhynchospora tenuis]
MKLLEKNKVIITEKSKEIEAAQIKIAELSKGIEEREKFLAEIEVEIVDIIKEVNGNGSDEEESLHLDNGNVQHKDTSQATEDVSMSHNSQPAAIPINKQLCFFATEEVNYDLDHLLGGSAEPLGKGTFGSTFNVTLESGLTRVVKRLRNVNLSENEFSKLITKFAELEHENIMPIKAYCFSNDEKLLVYDFVAMGSLSAALHGSNENTNRTTLNWEARAKIALAAARGVAHIHSVAPTFAHGNIKSSNILLTMNDGACVSDHGIYSLASPITSRVGRTGYLAPEVIDPTATSQKSDIYSFGVLLLELLTGKVPAEMALYGGVNLVKWSQAELRDGYVDAVVQDSLLKDQSVEGDELVQFLQLAIDCTREYPEMRPRMNDVVIRIVEILEARAKAMAKGKNGKKPVNRPESVRSVRTRHLW